MNFMKKMLLAFMAMSVVFASCSKDDKDDEEETPPPANVSYQPLTVGSTWTYKTKNNITSTEGSYVLAVTGADTSINGKAYKVFSRTGAGNEYYYNSNDEYYQFGGIANVTAPTELLYLKSNTAVGANWTETKNVTIPGVGDATVKVTYTNVEKLISYSVEGKDYADVIHVKLDLSDVTLSGTPVPIVSQDLHFYYAKGIGRIKQIVKLNITGLGQRDEELVLTASTIAP
jgi:hypothetical protein